MREGAAAFVGLGALEGPQAAVRRIHTPHPGVAPCTGGQSNLHASPVPLWVWAAALFHPEVMSQPLREGPSAAVGCRLLGWHASPPVCSAALEAELDE